MRSALRRVWACSSEKKNREHLRREDAQERGKRIDGGVANRRSIGAGDVAGEGQCRRIGHTARDEAAQVHEIYFPDGAREDADEQDRQNGDAKSGEQPIKPGGGEDGSEKFRARAQADSGKEKCDPEFAEGEIGIGRHVPYLPADAPDAAEDERHDERTAGQTETNWLRQTGEGDRHAAESEYRARCR